MGVVISLHLWIEDATGVSIQADDETVEYAVQLQRGRGSFTDNATASTLRVNILLGPPQDPDPFRGITAGAMIGVHLADAAGWMCPRFTGRVTDITLNHPQEGPARAEVTAIGAVADIASRGVGFDEFPEQRADQRVRDAATRAGVPVLIQDRVDAPDWTLTRREAKNESCQQVMEDAARSVGACIFDTTDGTVVFQDYQARSSGLASAARWDDMTHAWDTDTATWDEVVIKGTAQPPLLLPCDSVAYEPSWTQAVGTMANDVTVKHATGEVDVSDSESTARYGRRSLDVTTDLADPGDAVTRAGDLARAFGVPRWMLGNVEVVMNNLPPDILEDLTTNEIIGRRVRVTDLPQPAPASSFYGICEGITETYTPGRWTATLALTPQEMSYSVLTWEDTPPTYLWENARPSWQDAIELADL